MYAGSVGSDAVVGPAAVGGQGGWAGVRLGSSSSWELFYQQEISHHSQAATAASVDKTGRQGRELQSIRVGT